MWPAEEFISPFTKSWILFSTAANQNKSNKKVKIWWYGGGCLQYLRYTVLHERTLQYFINSIKDLSIKNKKLFYSISELISELTNFNSLFREHSNRIK